MIFVTVGTHEQQFDRLVRKMDELKETGEIQEQVVVQTGYSTFHPMHCMWKQWFQYEEIYEYMKRARIIITHGGPASFLMPVQMGKVPVVVPRLKEYGEHVNDHQKEFAGSLKDTEAGIIVVDKIDELGDVLKNYDRYAQMLKRNDYQSNNLRFNSRLEAEADGLLAGHGAKSMHKMSRHSAGKIEREQ